MHFANENKRADHAVKCISTPPPDCATTAWDVLCERSDARSFARSLSQLDNLMLRQRHGQSPTEYVHFMQQTFDDYNEKCEMIHGSATIHTHHLGLLMLRGISSNGPFGQANGASSTPSTHTTSCLRTKSWASFSTLPRTWRKCSWGLTPLSQAGVHQPYLHLSPLDVGHMVDVATTTVVVAVDVACLTSAVDVAASTTSSRLAHGAT
jgi:hypothetical protein